MNEEKIKILKSFNLFSDLTEKELKTIASYIQKKEFPAKTIFISQDEEEPEVVYFIYKGLARAYRITKEGQEVNLSIIEEGEVIGEMGVIEELPRSATVEAMKDTIAYVLTGKNFIDLLKKHPQISITLLKSLSKRLRKLTGRMEDMMSKNIEERTLEALRILSRFFPKKEILLSHEELATIVGATRARVTEVLDNLKNEEKIELHHRKIKLV